MAGKRPAWYRRPPWRTVVPLGALLLVGAVAYLAWTPGLEVVDGRHDRGENALWMQHGWLGDDAWFRRTGKSDAARDAMRDPSHVRATARRLAADGIRDVFPHLSPIGADGELPGVDDAQVARVLDAFGAEGLRVIPWTGGVLGGTARVDDPDWRERAARSIGRLMARHPRLAGVQLNIEPCPSGHEGFLALLDAVRAALPEGRLLGVAAYPPPTIWHPHEQVHWDRDYTRAVARRVDQLAVMMYDTALPDRRRYEALMADWTASLIAWTDDTDTALLLGAPTYDDAGVGYHDPAVENLRTALRGIHAGLARFATLPEHYRGVALYCGWETDAAEWAHWRSHFLRAR